MAGLNLNVGGYGSAGSAQRPRRVRRRRSPTGPTTIGTRAFGIGTSRDRVGPAQPGSARWHWAPQVPVRISLGLRYPARRRTA